MITSTSKAPGRLTLRECIAYGFGDYGINFFLKMNGAFLLLFYTDYMGLSPVLGGAILLFSRLLSSLGDLIIGGLADRSGNYKKWIICGGFASIFTFTAVYFCPPGGTTLRAVYAVLSFTLWNFSYTCTGTSVNALATLVAPDARDRARLNSVRFAVINLPLLIAMGGTEPMAAFFGGLLGEGALGFTAVAFLYGVVGFVFVLLSCRFVHEREKPQRSTKQAPVGIRQIPSLFRGNRPAQIMIAFFFLHFFAQNTSAGSLVYFCIYVLEDISFLGYYALCSIAASFVGTLLAPRIFTRVGVRKTSVVCCTIIVCSYILRFALRTHTAVILGGEMVCALSSGIMFIMAYTVAGDVVSYTRWLRGGKNIAVFYSMGMFFKKLGMAMAAFFNGVFLSWFGYVANQIQTPTAKLGINITYLLLPALCELILLLVMTRWELDSHESLQYIQKSDHS